MKLFVLYKNTQNILVNFPSEFDKDALLMLHVQPGFAELVIRSLQDAKLKGQGHAEFIFDSFDVVSSSDKPKEGLAWAKFVYLDEEGAEEANCTTDIANVKAGIENGAKQGLDLFRKLDHQFTQNWIRHNDAVGIELSNMIVNTKHLVINAYSGAQRDDNFKTLHSAKIPLELLGIEIPEDLKPLTKTDINTLYYYYKDKGAAKSAFAEFMLKCNQEDFTKLLKGFEEDMRNDLKLAKVALNR